MTPESRIDGAIAQGWGGVGPNGTHVNVVLARRGSATAAALLTTFASPSPGHTPVLVCVGPDQPSYEAVIPPTVMMNKATASEERHQTITWGAGQLGIGRAGLPQPLTPESSSHRLDLQHAAARSDHTHVRAAER